MFDEIQMDSVFDSLKNTLIEYKYEIIFGLIILGLILFILWKDSYPIKQHFNKIYESKKIPKIIWLYWNDPIDKAPPIVHMCVDLIHKFNTEFSVRLLNEQNYKEFVFDYY